MLQRLVTGPAATALHCRKRAVSAAAVAAPASTGSLTLTHQASSRAAATFLSASASSSNHPPHPRAAEFHHQARLHGSTNTRRCNLYVSHSRSASMDAAAASAAAAVRPQAGGGPNRQPIAPPRSGRRQGRQRREDNARQDSGTRHEKFAIELQEKDLSSSSSSRDTSSHVGRRNAYRNNKNRTAGGGWKQRQQGRRGKKSQQRPPVAAPEPRPIASSPWICLTNIPPLSLLEDITDEMARVMEHELDRGIVDLDEAERLMGDHTLDGDNSDAAEESLPLWDPSNDDDNDDDAATVSGLSGSFVQEARLMLSVLGRPCGWYLRFPNRSCVQAILSHADEAIAEKERVAVSCGGRILQLGEFAPPLLRTPSNRSNQSNETNKGKLLFGRFGSDTALIESSFDRAVDLRLDDSVIRVENCPADSHAEDMRYLFRRYDIIDSRKLADDASLSPVQLLVKGNYRSHRKGSRHQKAEVAAPISTNTFIIRMETAADARAALMDMQMVDFKGRQLRLARYPNQMTG